MRRLRLPQTEAARPSASAARPARHSRGRSPPTTARRGRPTPSPEPGRRGRRARARARTHSVRRVPLRRVATARGAPASRRLRNRPLSPPCTQQPRGARDPRRPTAPRSEPPTVRRTRRPTSAPQTRRGRALLHRPRPSASRYGPDVRRVLATRVSSRRRRAQPRYHECGRLRREPSVAKRIPQPRVPLRT